MIESNMLVFLFGAILARIETGDLYVRTLKMGANKTTEGRY